MTNGMRHTSKCSPYLRLKITLTRIHFDRFESIWNVQSSIDVYYKMCFYSFKQTTRNIISNLNEKFLIYTFHMCVCVWLCALKREQVLVNSAISRSNTFNKVTKFIDRLMFIEHIIQLSSLIRCGKRICIENYILYLWNLFTCTGFSVWAIERLMCARELNHARAHAHTSIYGKQSDLRMWKWVRAQFKWIYIYIISAIT